MEESKITEMELFRVASRDAIDDVRRVAVQSLADRLYYWERISNEGKYFMECCRIFLRSFVKANTVNG